jgi:hypothetical protein
MKYGLTPVAFYLLAAAASIGLTALLMYVILKVFG